MIRPDEATGLLRKEIGDQWLRLEELCESFAKSAEWSMETDTIASDWELASRELERYKSGEDQETTYADGERYLYGRTISQILARIVRYVPERNLEKLGYALDQLREHTSFYPQFVDAQVSESIEEAVDQLRFLTPTLIYEPEQDQRALVEIPKVIINVNEFLAERVALKPELLRQMSPRRFEEFIAEIFDHFGYEVEVTSATRDGGRDLIAISRRHGILSKTLVECKRYVPPNKVGVGHVRQLLGTKTAEVATRGVIVTTSYFSREARKLEEQNKYVISLQDFDAISSWARGYGLPENSRGGEWVIP